MKKKKLQSFSFGLHCQISFFIPIKNWILVKIPSLYNAIIDSIYTSEIHFVNKSEHKKEIAKIYNEWSLWQGKPNNINTSLHYVPNKSLALLYGFMLSFKIDIKSTILDAGCGNGAIALDLLNKEYNVYSCDISENASKYLLNYKLCSIDNLDYENDTFNLVYSFSVIHHLNNPAKAINEIKRVLKPNGFFITTQHTKKSVFTFQRKIKLCLFPSRNKHLNYITFKNTKDWIDLIEENGFTLLDKRGINYSFILTKMADILQYIYNKLRIDFFNPFAWIDERVGRILPTSVATELAYHSYLIFRRK